jgi:integrase
MAKGLTDLHINNLKPPAAGRLEITDPACSGLCLRVTANGVKSFAFRFRTNGQAERLTLGQYPKLSLRDARRRVVQLRHDILTGKNPSATKRQAPARTFAVLAERYLKEYSRRHKRSAAADERNLRLHVLPKWGRRDFTSITRGDVIELVERLIAAGKPVLANRVQALISGIFTFALDAGLITTHPAIKLRKRGTETIKTRVLSDDEIRLFWSRVMLPPVSPAVGLALRLILATGTRAGEAAGMAKDELEFGHDGTPTGWLIPASRSKNRRAHYVPLSPLASGIVVEAMSLAGGVDAVFPSPTGSGAIAGHALATAMRRLTESLVELGRARSGELPAAATWMANPPTAHDLRRTFATRLAAAGVHSDDIAALLNHVRGDVTGRHYDHHQRANEKRRALERWAQLLKSVLEPEAAPANIIALRS